MSFFDFFPKKRGSANANRVIVILGMHRSGTSAVAGSLQRLGVDFGPRLMPPTSANERGYYEHIDVVNLHDRLLLALNSSWDETAPLPDGWVTTNSATSIYREEMLALLRRDFSGAKLWGLKDPRFCRLLPWWEPIWRELAVEPVFLIVLRDPREIAASLVRREGFSGAKAYLLWLQHLIDAERFTRRHPRLFIDFADYLARPAEALRRIAGAFEMKFAMESVGIEEVKASFLDSSLRHNQAQKTPTAALPPWVERADALLRETLREEPAREDVTHGLDQLREELIAASSLYEPLLRHRASDLTQQLEALRKQASWYEAEWQKAKRRVEKLTIQREVTEKRKGSQKLITKNDNNTSYVRKQCVSKLIKRMLSGMKRIFHN